MVRPSRCSSAQQLPEQPPRLRVEADGRLVEQQHLRVVHQGASDEHPLLETSGERRRLRVGLLGELQLVEQPRAARLALAARQTEVAAVEEQDLAHRKVAVEVAHLRHHGDLAPRGDRIARHVDTADLDPSGGGPHQRGQAADRRALAGAVGPEQAEELAAPDRERDAAHRLDRWRLARARVGLAQLLDEDGGAHRELGGEAGWRAARGRGSPGGSRRSSMSRWRRASTG